jgi:hypothetical protein
MALNFNYLNLQIEELEKFFPMIDLKNQDVSKVNVGWHLSHSLKVINEVCSSLKNSKPSDFKSQFNLKREIVFALGSFPRGKARAPKFVMPEGKVTMEILLDQLRTSKENLKSFESLERNNYVDHPYFNQLNKIQAKRLLEVHTKHHLKIIKDIIKTNSNKKAVI